MRSLMTKPCFCVLDNCLAAKCSIKIGCPMYTTIQLFSSSV